MGRLGGLLLIKLPDNTNGLIIQIGRVFEITMRIPHKNKNSKHTHTPYYLTTLTLEGLLSQMWKIYTAQTVFKLTCPKGESGQKSGQFK